MKKIFFFIFFLVSWSVSFAQTFTPPRSSATVTVQDSRYRALLNFYFTHTRGVNMNGGLDSLGMAFYEDSSGHILYRDTVLSGGHKWSYLLKNGDAGLGTVTKIIAGLGFLPVTITDSGTLNVDTAFISNFWVRRHDSTVIFVTPTQMNAQGFIKNITGIPAGGDLTGTYPNPTINLNAVTFAKIQQIPGFTFVANPTASLANPQASYFKYGLIWNNDSVKVDTATLKSVFGGGGGPAGITQLTGDGTAGPGSGSQVLTLATVNGNVYGSNTFLKFSVNGKGLITGATPVVSGDIISALGFTPISLTSLSATAPIVYNNTTGVISCPTCGSSSGGISSLNTLTAANQLFAIGYSGTSVNIVSSGVTHTFNIPLVTGADTGLATPANYVAWNAKASVPGAGLVYSTGSALADVTVLAPLVYSGGILSADTVVGSQNLATQGYVTRNTAASVSNVDGSLTISPNIGAVVASLNTGHANTFTVGQTFNGSTSTFNASISMGSNIAFATDNAYAIGAPTIGAQKIWTHALASPGQLSLSSTTGNPVGIYIGSTQGITLLSTGQVQFNNYTGSAYSNTSNDSILTINPANGNIGWKWGQPFNLYVSNYGASGLGTIFAGGTPFDSVIGKKLIGGIDILLTQNADSSITINADTLSGNQNLATQGYVLRNGGSGGGLTSFTSPNNTINIGGTLTAPTVDVNPASPINWTTAPLPAVTNTTDFGSSSKIWNNGWINTIVASSQLVLKSTGANSIFLEPNGTAQFSVASGGAARFNAYGTGAISGTPVTFGTFDATGHLIEPSAAQISSLIGASTLASEVITNPTTGAITTRPLLAGLSVNYATTVNLASNTYANGPPATLTAVNPGALGTIDGVASAVGDTVAVINEGNPAHNGIYIVTTEGNVSTAYVLTRETFASFAYNETAGASFYVEKGTTHGVTTLYQTTTGPITMGTTNLVYSTQNLGTGLSGTATTTFIPYATATNTLGTAPNTMFFTVADSSANFKKVIIKGTNTDSCSLCITVYNNEAWSSSQLPGIHLYPANTQVNPSIFLHDSRSGDTTGLEIANFNTTFDNGVSILRSNEPGGFVIQTVNTPMFFETRGYDGADFAGAIQGATKHWSIDDAAGGERGRALYVYGTVQLEDSILIGAGLTGGFAFIGTATPYQGAYTQGRGWKIQVQNYTNQNGYTAIAIDSNSNQFWLGGTAYNAAGGLIYSEGSSAFNQIAQTAAGTSSQVLIGGTTPTWSTVNLSSMVSNTLPVANGGTGNNTLTAYAVLTGGTTSTGALQQVSGLGTAGYVLTSNGAGALPTWQAATGGGGSGSPGGSNQDIQVKSGSNFFGGGGTFIQDTVYKGVRLNIQSLGSFPQPSSDSTGLWIRNTAVAASGAQQFSPTLTLEGQGWKTTATAASQSVKFHMMVEPVQGAANPTGLLVFGSNINGSATYNSDSLTLSSAGTLTLESAGPTYNAAVTASGTASFNFITSSTSAIVGGLDITGSSGEERLENASGYFLTLYANGGERMRIIGTDVLIGTTTDNSSLNLGDLRAYSGNLGTGFVVNAATSNDALTAASGTVTNMAANVMNTPTFSATNTGVTYTNASTLYISGAPIAGTNVTETNRYSLNTVGNVIHTGGQLILGSIGSTITWNPNNALLGSIFSEQISTLNDATTAASTTVTNAYVTGITSPTLTATNTSVTYTNAFTMYINAAPTAGTNTTITNAYALGVNGPALFQSGITATSVNLVGSNDLTSQTAATTVTSYAVPGSSTFNTFRVGGYITVTAVSLDVIQLQVTWTDETSTSRTQSFFVQGATTGIGATGANAYSPIDIRVKKGTTITVATVLTTGTGSITYDTGANITQLY